MHLGQVACKVSFNIKHFVASRLWTSKAWFSYFVFHFLKPLILFKADHQLIDLLWCWKTPTVFYPATAVIRQNRFSSETVNAGPISSFQTKSNRELSHYNAVEAKMIALLRFTLFLFSTFSSTFVHHPHVCLLFTWTVISLFVTAL